MLSNMLGVIIIITGLLWLFKPEILRNRLKKKMNRKLKLIVYGFVIMFGFLIIGSVIKAPGLLPKIVGIMGIILAIKGILLITSKASEKMLNWLADRPLGFFRIWAFVILIMGIMLILA
ncbi:MAG: hypothetical protein U9R52_04795 [Candidatus Omnitrophota bacterium]|nr:hypothetical protein [Candidatus Omnitrophota bacterium]